ncbi:MAG: hypothetical protein KAJ72_04150 [Candidatus Heimdallarchaeota archaeon]|nr:hypothetical protein [Candidatus Heimdallarchaeota archaeon]MCK5409875.1 hypothetical protein [Candidatus Heimdallarchaeota archaeon]
MSNSPPFQKAFRFEIVKFILIVLPIVAGGIVFAVFVPLSEKLSWFDFLFFAIVGFLIILSQCVSFFFKRKRIKEMQVAQGFISSTNTGFAPSTFTSIKSSAPKEALKIDEYSVAYCPTCGKSFTKKYKFCPNCGSCKIKGML